MAFATSLSTEKSRSVCDQTSLPRGVSRSQLDQLYVHAHLIVCFLDTAFQKIGDTELFRDLRRLLMRFLVTQRGRARDHFEIPIFESRVKISS